MAAATGRENAAGPATARVTCCQITPVTGDQEANARLTTAAIDAAAGSGADVVVLPELVTCGYSLVVPERIADCGITPDHDVFAEWAAHAGEAVVVGGFSERAPDGRLHNSVAVVDATGIRAVHRKTHLWGSEGQVFTPGDAAPPVVDTTVGRLGVLICYEMEFPEVTRALAMSGAELVAVPANWPLVGRPAGERPPEVVIAMAAARVNRMAIACCDRGGTGWTGGSSIIDASGWVVASARDGVISADLQLADARDKALGPHNDALADRRAELYDSWMKVRSNETSRERP